MSRLKTTFAAMIVAIMGIAATIPVVHAQSAPQATTLSVDALVKYFEAIAFGRPGTPAANDVVVKWPDATVSLALEEPQTKLAPGENKKFLAMVKAHVTALSRLSGKKFNGVHDPSTADIRIFFVHKADMGKIYGPDIDPNAVKAGAAVGECYSIRWRKTQSALFKAIVVVNVDLDPKLVDSCLLRELTQSMGLPHDSDAMRPSIFSKKDHLTALSAQDQVLIRTLYDPRMTAGLPRDKALKLARTIITELGKPAK